MLNEFLEFLSDKIDSQTAIIIAISILAVMVTLAIGYVIRVRDHIREETRIDDVHFRKIKEYVRDLCDGVEDIIIVKGQRILGSTPLTLCTEITTGSECSKVQAEKWDSDARRAIDSKLYAKSCGWMRENGFHSYDPNLDSDVKKINEYVDLRAKQLIKALIPYLNAKAKVRTPLLYDKVGEFFSEESAKVFIKDITLYTITEMAEADKSIREYRIAHGFLPQTILRIFMSIKWGKK